MLWAASWARSVCKNNIAAAGDYSPALPLFTDIQKYTKYNFFGGNYYEFYC